MGRKNTDSLSMVEIWDRLFARLSSNRSYDSPRGRALNGSLEREEAMFDGSRARKDEKLRLDVCATSRKVPHLDHNPTKHTTSVLIEQHGHHPFYILAKRDSPPTRRLWHIPSSAVAPIGIFAEETRKKYTQKCEILHQGSGYSGGYWGQSRVCLMAVFQWS
jgi:hypothetical protein